MNDTPPSALLDRPEASTALDHLALLVVRGADARSFLDSQLTRNVPEAAPASAAAPASLAGYCSPKGRLLASVVLWSEGDAISMLLSRDIADTIAKRLRMYVLRAKVTLDDVSASSAFRGTMDPPDLPASVAALAPWTALRSGDRTWVRYPDVSTQKRYLRIGPSDPAADEPDGVVEAAFWRWLDIRSGLPRITTGTQDRFVPQMLNLEALGAVDFRKGCFPGQEIVARSQYLGKLKRRMALASTAGSITPPAPGTDVWTAGDREASGLVVNAERGLDGRIALLVELPLALFASTELRVGSIAGAPLTLEPLPYALPDNEVFVRPKL